MDLAQLATEYDVGLPIERASSEDDRRCTRRLLGDEGLRRRLRANAAAAAGALRWEDEEQRLATLLAGALGDA